MEIADVNNQYLLQKFPGKGGWTYASIPEIKPSESSPFGWRKVNGSIDGFELKSYKLMPMGNGTLFLPVKAEIRKKIGKKEGDNVHVILHLDESPEGTPEDFILCLKDDPNLLAAFTVLPEAIQKKHIHWINEARTIENKADRIAEILKKIIRNVIVEFFYST